MKTKIYIGVSLFGFLAISIVVFLSWNGRSDAQIKSSKIRVEVQNSDSATDKNQIHLSCPEMERKVPNELPALSCDLLNASDKELVAYVISYTVKGMHNGEPWQASSNIINDILMHPSLFEKRKNNFVGGGNRIPIVVLPATYDEGSVVESISIQVSFAEFADSSAMGTESYASKQIAELRKGFAAYRTIFAKRYNARKHSKIELESLLRELGETPEYRNLSPGQQEGAQVFDKFIRRVYRTDGEGGVKNVID
jgi:hypothetical protein